MNLLAKSLCAVTEVEYVLHDETSVFYYKEWIHEGKVIDCILRDKDGNSIDDANLLEAVQEYVDTLD